MILPPAARLGHIPTPERVKKPGDRTLRLLSFFLCATLTGAVIAGTVIGGAGLPTSAVAQENYRIIPGDTLNVTVLEDPNLNSSVLVRPDGRVTLPIAGSIQVVGRSPEQVQAIVRSRLSGSFNVTPTVTVSITGLGDPEEIPDIVYVLGQVNEPGAIEVLPPRTINVLQAIAQAGGLGRFARGEDIQIRRVDLETGEETVFAFDYSALEDGLLLDSNIPLRDGDVIFVPERGLFD